MEPTKPVFRGSLALERTYSNLLILINMPRLRKSGISQRLQQICVNAMFCNVPWRNLEFYVLLVQAVSRGPSIQSSSCDFRLCMLLCSFIVAGTIQWENHAGTEAGSRKWRANSGAQRVVPRLYSVQCPGMAAISFVVPSQRFSRCTSFYCFLKSAPS